MISEEMKKHLERIHELVEEAMTETHSALQLSDMTNKTIRELMAPDVPTNEEENAMSLITAFLLLQDLERGLYSVIH